MYWLRSVNHDTQYFCGRSALPYFNWKWSKCIASSLRVKYIDSWQMMTLQNIRAQRASRAARRRRNRRRNQNNPDAAASREVSHRQEQVQDTVSNLSHDQLHIRQQQQTSSSLNASAISVPSTHFSRPPNSIPRPAEHDSYREERWSSRRQAVLYHRLALFVMPHDIIIISFDFVERCNNSDAQVAAKFLSEQLKLIEGFTSINCFLSASPFRTGRGVYKMVIMDSLYFMIRCSLIITLQLCKNYLECLLRLLIYERQILKSVECIMKLTASPSPLWRKR